MLYSLTLYHVIVHYMIWYVVVLYYRLPTAGSMLPSEACGAAAPLLQRHAGQKITHQTSQKWNSVGKCHWKSIGQFQYTSTEEITILRKIQLESEIPLETRHGKSIGKCHWTNPRRFPRCRSLACNPFTPTTTTNTNTNNNSNDNDSTNSHTNNHITG